MGLLIYQTGIRIKNFAAKNLYGCLQAGIFVLKGLVSNFLRNYQFLRKVIRPKGSPANQRFKQRDAEWRRAESLGNTFLLLGNTIFFCSTDNTA